MKNRTFAGDTWLTPRAFFDKLDARFNFDTFDPCPPECDTSKFNGLEADWAPRTFCNPPYSRKVKEQFIHKAFQESVKGKFVVMLLPVSTSTMIFHHLIQVKARVEFLEGRLHFEGLVEKDGQIYHVNPGQGMYPLIAPDGAIPRKRNGQHDSMLAIFGMPTCRLTL